MKKPIKETLIAEKLPKWIKCKCTDYNGGQCYNCLNGGHYLCTAEKGCDARPAVDKEILNTELDLSEIAEVDEIALHDKLLENFGDELNEIFIENITRVAKSGCIKWKT